MTMSSYIRRAIFLAIDIVMEDLFGEPVRFGVGKDAKVILCVSHVF